MTAPRQRERHRQRVRARSARVEPARLHQCRESGGGRLRVRARKALPAVCQCLGLDGSSQVARSAPGFRAPGCSIRAAHCSSGAARAAGSDFARNRARPASPASSARRARRSVMTSPGPPRARHQANAGSQASGRLFGVSHVSVSSSTSPSAWPSATRAASQWQRSAGCVSRSSRYCSRYVARPVAPPGWASHAERNVRVTGRSPCCARNAAISSSSGSRGSSPGCAATGRTARAAGSAAPPAGRGRADSAAGPRNRRRPGRTGTAVTAAMAATKASRTLLRARRRPRARTSPAQTGRRTAGR